MSQFRIGTTALIVATLAMLLAGCAKFETRDARLIKRVNPIYPTEAAAQGIEGRVFLEFTIGQDGRIKDIVVVEATPPGTFEAAAIEALSQWEYEPALRRGRAVDVPEGEIVLEFTVQPN